MKNHLDIYIKVLYNLNMKNLEKYIKKINQFNNLNQSDKNKISERIKETCEKAFKEFADIFQKDKELCEVYNFLEDYENSKKFKWEDQLCYQQCYCAGNDEDKSDYWVFRPEYIEERKYKYEHFDEILEPLQKEYDVLSLELEKRKEELEDVQKNRGIRKFITIIRLKSQVKKLDHNIWVLKEDIRKLKYETKEYKEHLELHNKKEYYEQNYEKLVAPAEKLYKERTQEYATKIIEKFLKKEPALMCIECNIRSGKGKENFNKVFNDKRTDVIYAMTQIQEAEESIGL